MGYSLGSLWRGNNDFNNNRQNVSVGNRLNNRGEMAQKSADAGRNQVQAENHLTYSLISSLRNSDVDASIPPSPVSSPLLSPAAPPPRLYQSAISEAVLKNGSTLVVLPTGLGKTLVAVLVAAAKLNEGGRVLFLAPTRPLAAQHEKVCREWLNLKPEEIVSVSGLIMADKRKPLYLSPARLVISTPQTIANDLEAGRLAFDFSLVIFDECHRSVGKYAYTYVANAANGKLASAVGSPRPPAALVLGLTASPGGDRKKITDIIQALGIQHVQIRTSEDPDVAPYVKPLEIEWIRVELTPALLEAKEVLGELIKAQTETLRKMGFVGQFASKKSLSEMRMRILASGSRLRFSALSHHATLFSLVHVQELLETQGVESVQRFVQRVREREPSKAQVRLLHNPKFMAMVEKLNGAAEHPKLAKLVELARSRPSSEKSIVFCQYRDQVGVLERELTKAGLKAKSFMGKKEGVTAKDQQKTLAEFREGLFDILVATSIGEEGLDIPSVDNVIFYEPVASEIRHIQRRGRAGRAKLGHMFGLMTANTRDQAFFWSSRRKEEKMKKIVGGLAAVSPTDFKSVLNASGRPKGKKSEEPKKSAPQAPKENKDERTEPQSPVAYAPKKKGQSKISDF